MERKFLVVPACWKQQITTPGVYYKQGYLNTSKERTVRVRIAGENGFLTIKGMTHGITRLEFEYPIPKADAEIILQTLCIPPMIEKIRYQIPYSEESHLVWEIDEFLGENQGLVLAEIELCSEQDAIILPSWISEEVSHDARYYNSYLQQFPYNTWKK